MQPLTNIVRISDPGSLTVWCVAKREEAELLRHTITPLAAHSLVKHVVIVHTGPSRPACYGELQRARSNVHEFHQDFGEGLDRAVPEGGFDQVGARNVALAIAEQFGDKWLLQFDVDDYYDTKLVDMLTLMPTSIRAVRCACYHMLSADEYWLNHQKVCQDGPEPLINPHIRLWRNDKKRRFAICTSLSKAEGNKTRHCGVDFSDLFMEQLAAVSEPMHFHLHYLLAKSDPSASRRRASLPGNAQLPADLLSFLRDWTASNGKHACGRDLSRRPELLGVVS